VSDSRPHAIAGPFGLSATEVRVLGCLLEKQKTTPDVYPLSLNALRLACNQSTNREPVVDYAEGEIREALHRLERRGLARLASGAGSRAPKYRHLLADALPMDEGERAILCVLMLRGPQTPGELKQRSERMHPFGAIDSVHAALQSLIERELAVRLQRRPGQKEERYAELLRGDARPEGVAERTHDPGAEHRSGFATHGLEVGHHSQSATDRSAPEGLTLEGLHVRLARLEREVAELRASLIQQATSAR
jgi:uncharacterized protein YceH (UPF0502 family)